MGARTCLFPFILRLAVNTQRPRTRQLVLLANAGQGHRAAHLASPWGRPVEVSLIKCLDKPTIPEYVLPHPGLSGRVPFRVIHV